MDGNKGLMGWTAAAMAIAGLAMSPAIAAILDSDSNPISLSARGAIGSFTPALVDPDLAAQFELKALKGNSGFRFTPAGQKRVENRAITVVVRQSSDSSRAIGIRPKEELTSVGAAPVAAKITQTSYSLGAAKGWKSFAIAEKPSVVQNLGSRMPDLSEIGGKGDADDGNGKRSRFNPRLSIDAAAPTGSAPRALDASQKDMMVDVGGSYSLTRNLDVTAGVRLENKRDRMAPLTDSREDSQAVYIGTQFRF